VLPGQLPADAQHQLPRRRFGVRLEDAPSFLTHDELAAHVARFTHRPGWALSVFADPWEGPVFRVVAKVDNAYHPGEQVELRINSRMPPIPSVDYLMAWVQWRLTQIESHEAREWLRVDGGIVFDPHDPVEPA
jgi:hypothetical protein